jgi:hypothetical protein
MTIRLYLDEDVWPGLAGYLREKGYDVLTTEEAGRSNRRLSDESQLEFAAEQGRVLLTFNHCDFAPLDTLWKTAGKRHAGILLCPQLPPGRLCIRVEAHLQRITADGNRDLLLWC